MAKHRKKHRKYTNTVKEWDQISQNFTTIDAYLREHRLWEEKVVAFLTLQQRKIKRLERLPGASENGGQGSPPPDPRPWP